jgi:hypothetical protein
MEPSVKERIERRRQGKNRKGFIYLISDGMGHIKIGRTTNWKRRFTGDFSPASRILLVAESDDAIRDEGSIPQAT